MSIYPHRSEKETTILDAQSSRGKTDQQRAEAFRGLLETIEILLAHLPPEERRRRRKAGRMLDPRPEPWWKNLRKSAWPQDNASAS